MTDLEYRCVHGHDKCGEMYPGSECPYCERVSDLERSPFVKMGLVVEALWADAVDRPKFYASMGLNFEKIIQDALAAARREGAEAEHERMMEAYVLAQNQQWAAGREAGAEEMRERAAQRALELLGGHWLVGYIRRLPLTPEEPK